MNNLTALNSSPTLNKKTDSIIDFINNILNQAIEKQASDVHFEPYQNYYRIRCRIDGLLHQIAEQSIDLGQRFAARLKVMADMDTAEKRLPLDGRFKFTNHKQQNFDLRISSLPTLWGEKIVVRILHSNKINIDITELGLEASQEQIYKRTLQQPQGMILITGPTGSGKTFSLYAGLKLINKDEINISTVEDPIEIQLEGINQLQVKPQIGLNFAQALRALLRQDPDVIMLGEIRDLETAEIAIKAAQTGHSLISTLHTNSAIDAINRLKNMGIPDYNIAGSIKLIMAQRLVRKLCPECKQPTKFEQKSLLKSDLEQLKTNTTLLYKADKQGCTNCHKGYKGRIGIFEVLPISPVLNQQIMSTDDKQLLLKAAQQEGFETLFDIGLKKVAQGLISLEELNRAITD